MDNQTLNMKPKNGYGFIYCYTSPSEKRYIGQTRTTLKERLKNKAKGYKNCKYFYNAIQKYGIENFKVEILEEVPYSDLNMVETDYIIRYDTVNRDCGYNIITDSYNYLALLNRVPIYGYNEITGKLEYEFPSYSEASRALNINRRNLQRAINNNCRARNLFWRTERFEQIEVPILQNNHPKQIHCYDYVTGNFLATYNSIREAAQQMHTERRGIQRQLANSEHKGNVKTKFLFRSFKVDNLYHESSTTIPLGVDSSESKGR